MENQQVQADKQVELQSQVHAQPEAHNDLIVQKNNQNHLVSRQANKTFKAKCGIFFGYNGEKYLGMQYQRQTENTIQNTLHKLMVDGGFILQSNKDQLKRISWSRAARTDKRVHALCNGISVKLQISEKFSSKQAKQGQKQIDFDKLREYFNSQLPIDIRLFSIKRVAKGFDMRHDALTRVYNYIIPLYIFQKYQDFKNGNMSSLQQQEKIVEKLNALCKNYLGTHNFNNFTKGYKQGDPRCQRYMISMKAESVQKQVFQRYWSAHSDEISERNIQKQRYVRFTLVGQSFIYHQIRKMIGLLIKIFAEDLQGQTAIKQAFKPQRYDLYLAPGQGLYLNRMTFECYNRRKAKCNQKTVELNQEEEQRVLKFRQYLESQILHHEIKEKIFSSWLTNRFQYKAQDKEQSGQEQEQQQQKREEQGMQTQQKNNQKKQKKQRVDHPWKKDKKKTNYGNWFSKKN